MNPETMPRLAARLSIRRAVEDDCAAMAEMRLSLFIEERKLSDAAAQRSTFAPLISEHLAARMRSGECIGWIGETAGQAAATGALLRFVRLPHPGNVTGKEAYLLNMYTLPRWRGLGFAQAITLAAIEFARADGIGRLWLDASDQAAPLYRRLGFVPTADAMELLLANYPDHV